MLNRNEVIKDIEENKIIVIMRGFSTEQLIASVDAMEKVIPALIKKDKWEYVLQKAAELGATKILPLETSRTVVKSNDEKVDKKLKSR